MIAGSMALTGAAFAGSPSSYQVTGPITAVDDSMMLLPTGEMIPRPVMTTRRLLTRYLYEEPRGE